jgi:hypothetical protein
LRGRCAPEERLGGFELLMESDSATFSGAVYDRVAHSAELQQLGADDSCVLIKQSPPFCDPPCADGKMCMRGGACEAGPQSLDLGAVVVHGLTAPLTLHAAKPGNRYFSAELAYPPAAPARPVRFQAEGGALGVLQLRSEGVAPLETDAGAWLIERGRPLQISWKVSHRPTQATVRVTVDVDRHGTSPVTLTCSAADTGQLTISSALIDQLLDVGIAGFAAGNIYREVSDHVDLDAGCLDLTLAAHRKRRLQISGAKPCPKDAACADGD